MEKLSTKLIAVVDRIVHAFLQVFLAEHSVDLDEVFELIVGIFGGGRFVIGRLHAGHIEDVENQDRVVGNHGAAGLGDDVRVSDFSLIANAGDGFDDVSAILGDGVVA